MASSSLDSLYDSTFSSRDSGGISDFELPPCAISGASPLDNLIHSAALDVLQILKQYVHENRQKFQFSFSRSPEDPSSVDEMISRLFPRLFKTMIQGPRGLPPVLRKLRMEVNGPAEDLSSEISQAVYVLAQQILSNVPEGKELGEKELRDFVDRLDASSAVNPHVLAKIDEIIGGEGIRIRLEFMCNRQEWIKEQFKEEVVKSLAASETAAADSSSALKCARLDELHTFLCRWKEGRFGIKIRYLNPEHVIRSLMAENVVQVERLSVNGADILTLASVLDPVRGVRSAERTAFFSTLLQEITRVVNNQSQPGEEQLSRYFAANSDKELKALYQAFPAFAYCPGLTINAFSPATCILKRYFAPLNRSYHDPESAGGYLSQLDKAFGTHLFFGIADAKGGGFVKQRKRFNLLDLKGREKVGSYTVLWKLNLKGSSWDGELLFENLHFEPRVPEEQCNQIFDLFAEGFKQYQKS